MTSELSNPILIPYLDVLRFLTTSNVSSVASPSNFKVEEKHSSTSPLDHNTSHILSATDLTMMPYTRSRLFLFFPGGGSIDFAVLDAMDDTSVPNLNLLIWNFCERAEFFS